MIGHERGWWKHLRALWNYDPVAMQAEMLERVKSHWAGKKAWKIMMRDLFKNAGTLGFDLKREDFSIGDSFYRTTWKTYSSEDFK